uniref:Transcription initiation factor TFIID subunit 12 n=1 Tax=Acrobeloides nanus TaxID=290746 RepID=A0A914E9R0_9BILA
MGLRFHIPSQSQSSFPDGSSKGYRFIYPPGKNRQEVENGVLAESRLDELMKIMDPSAELSPEVKIVLLDYVDEFVDKVIKKSADLAKLSGSRVVRPADAKFVLEHIYSE